MRQIAMPLNDLPHTRVVSSVVNDTTSLVVVMPAYNEEENLPKVIREWSDCFRKLEISFIFLVIDDGSKDRSIEVLKGLQRDFPELVFWAKENEGHGKTCFRGYQRALEFNSEWVFQIDSDGQCDPQFFSQFWDVRDDADLVFGQRITRDDGRVRQMMSFICRLGTWLVTGEYVRDPNVPYRLMRSNALRLGMKHIPDEINVYNVALAVALKREPSLRWKFLPIHFPCRAGGTNSINLKAVLQMGWEMLLDLKGVK